MVREARQRFRFPRSARLTRASEFRLVKQDGKAFTGRYVVLAVFRPPDETSVRAGLVTSRRVGPAVVRNRVRRRLREIYRLNRARIGPGWWLVTIARVSASSASLAQLQQDWLRLAGRASILETS
ncbi:MAG: ribonuclease P protein component [Verrucomicrobia bacterium]|nr:ribonuclease P protein component [Verrucomicrobiota bacterium]